ncbi:hypothetical protein GYMLUDRAFT_192695 [Collybiopsis luxurians FD-317 M1]|nr:hypothetical protein GYMLUDRAFT_192695 [Collybiopsis luxurians FD-317 M1]
MIMSLPSLTPTYHRSTYPAISPTRPSLSQAEKTVLITGGGGGIGFEIAHSFAKASASRVILVGRRSGFLDEAVTKLREEFGQSGPTEFIAHQGDIGDEKSISALWDYLHSQNIFVHVLVLNAAHFSQDGPDTLSMDKKELKRSFDVNVAGNFFMSVKFVQQPLRPAADHPHHQLYFVNVSTAGVHMYPSPEQNAYSSSKAAFMALLGRIADERKVNDVQIISYHPGALYSETASKNIPQDLINWDEMSLPADYAVWAASPEAAWLHGRFVWAHWDVDELREAAHNVESEIGKQWADEKAYLKMGILGLPSIQFGAFLNQ